MTNPPPADAPLRTATEGTTLQALERFCDYTRSAVFNLQLGVREIRLLRSLPWENTNWELTGAELTTMQKLLMKGLLVRERDYRPQLSEAGKLVRQLLVLSRHIQKFTPPVNPLDLLHDLVHIVQWNHGMVLQSAELRTVDNEEHLVLRTRRGCGSEEWAVPRSAFRQIG